MSQNIKAFLINAIFSALIGLIVGLATILLHVFQQETIVHLLLKGSFIGLIIGSVSKLSVIVLRHNLPKKPFRVYLIVFLFTGISTIISSYPFDQPFTYNVVIIAGAETLAMLATFIKLRYFIRLNAGLKRKQALFKQDIR